MSAQWIDSLIENNKIAFFRNPDRLKYLGTKIVTFLIVKVQKRQIIGFLLVKFD